MTESGEKQSMNEWKKKNFSAVNKIYFKNVHTSIALFIKLRKRDTAFFSAVELHCLSLHWWWSKKNCYYFTLWIPSFERSKEEPCKLTCKLSSITFIYKLRTKLEYKFYWSINYFLFHFRHKWYRELFSFSLLYLFCLKYFFKLCVD